MSAGILPALEFLHFVKLIVESAVAKMATEHYASKMLALI
jgi:hypothetical protein